MKISMNPVGNYSNISRQPVAQVKQPQKVEMSEQLISNSEKQFFANKYPENHKEINQYHFYQRSGQMAGVSIGTLVNKRV